MKTKSPVISSKIFLVLLLGLCLQSAQGQITTAPGVWQSNGPQFHAEVTGIIADLDNPFLMHIGTRGPVSNVVTGLFRSTDGGVSWALADDEQLNDVTVMSLLEVNNIIFVSVVNPNNFGEKSGLYFSSDKGKSWQLASIPRFGIRDTPCIVSIVSFGGTLFAGAVTFDYVEDIRGFGLIMSTDNGENWESVPEMDGRIVANLVASETKIYAGTSLTLPNRGVYDPSELRPEEHGVFVSEDGGVTWTQYLADDQIEALLYFDNTVYAGTKENGLFYTSDDNIDWQHPVRDDGAPMDFGTVANLTPIFPDSLLALSANIDNEDFEVYTSADGQTWTLRGRTESPITTLISDQHPRTPFLFIGTEQHGAIRIVDIDRTNGLEFSAWVEAEPPLAGTHITALAANAGGNDAFAGTLVNGLFRAPSGAPVWFPTSPQPTFIPVYGVEISNGRALHAYGAGVYQSVDGGKVWERSVTKFDDPISSLVYHFEQDWFLLGSAPTDSSRSSAKARAIGIWRSRDALNWEQAGVDSVLVYQLLISNNGSAVYAATNRGVYKTEESGGDWRRVLDRDVQVFSILQVDDVGFWAGGLDTLAGEGLYFSEDGEDWQPVGNEILGAHVSALAYYDERIYVGTQYRGIWFSDVGGQTGWQKANIPYPEVPFPKYEWDTTVEQFHVIDDSVLIAGFGGLALDDIDDAGLFYMKNGIDWYSFDEESVDHVPMNDKDIRKIIQIDDVVYVATDGHGVFRSEKSDISKWFPLNTGLTNLHTRNLLYMKGTRQLVLSTIEGVFTQKLDVTNPELVYFDLGGGKGFENSEYTKAREVRFFIYGFDPLDDGFDRNPDFMRVSEDPTFSDVEWLPYDDDYNVTTPNFTLSEGDGAKTIYAQVRDHSWNLSKVLSWDIILDQTKPQFDAHTPPSTARVGQPVIVSFSVTEPNIESVTFRLRRPGQQWDPRRSFTFFDDTDGGFDIEIPGEFISNGGFDYRIIVTDRAGNVDSLRSNALDFVSLPVNLNEAELGNSNSLPAGTGAASYRMVSAPMDLQNTPAVKEVFKDLGKYGRRDKWRFYGYQGNGQWQEGESTPMRTGAGYFMIRREGGPLTNKMAGVTTPTSDGVTGKIPGWHLRANDWTLIGNPYNARLSLGQLMFKSDSTRLNEEGVAGQIWLYDGNWKNPQTTPDLALEAWSGLFVRTAQADTIIFANAADPFKPVGKVSVPPGGFSEPGPSASVRLLSSEKKATDEIMKVQLPDLFGMNQGDKVRTQKQKSHRREEARIQFSKPANALAENRVTQNSSTNSSLGDTIALAKPSNFLATLGENEWLIQIIATSQEISDEVNYFGVRKEAKDALDKHDWYEPPFMLAGVSLTFPHADWDTPVELAADVRPFSSEGHRWEIAIKGEPTHAVQLSFANIETVPGDFQIMLVDETTKIVHDLRKEPTTTVRIPEAGTKTLTIIAGNDFYISQYTEGMLGVPTTFALDQNYPNPFNPSTTIRYALPVAGRVTLKVFDMMGRAVLIPEENKACEAGYYEVVADMSALSTGVYFYRIDVDGEPKYHATRKMLFVK